jgi:hypothetical protein
MLTFKNLDEHFGVVFENGQAQVQGDPVNKVAAQEWPVTGHVLIKALDRGSVHIHG